MEGAGPIARGAKTTTGLVRWGWRIVLAATLAFGLAGLAASLVVPRLYRAEAVLSGAVDWRVALAAHPEWLRGTSQVAMQPAWELPARAAPVVGAVDEGNDNVRVWVIDDSATGASTLLDQTVRSLTDALPTQPPIVVASAGNGAVTDGTAISSDRSTLGIEALEKRLDQATREVQSAETALRDFDEGHQARAAQTGDAQSLSARLQLAREASEAWRRVRDLVSSDDPGAEAALPGPIDGWSDFLRAARQKRELTVATTDLSKSLASDNPRLRIAQLRLSQLAAEVDERREEVARRVASRLEAADHLVRTLEDRQNDLASSEAGAATAATQRQALEDSLRQALDKQDTSRMAVEAERSRLVGDTQAGNQPGLSGETTSATVQRVDHGPEMVGPHPAKAIGAAAVFGFLLSAVSLTAARLVSRHRNLDDVGPRSIPELNDGVVSIARSVEDERFVAGSNAEPVDLDELIDGIIASDIARVTVATADSATSATPMGASLARRLALRGRNCVLVDLSPEQTSSRTMGIAPNSPGLLDLIEGRVSYAAIAHRDFATRADAVGRGGEPATAEGGGPGSRRNVLDFIERSCETLVIDCGSMPPQEVFALHDADAALLLDISREPGDAARTRMAQFYDAGIDDFILVADPAERPDRSSTV